LLQNVGYINFIIITFIGSGYLILRYDGNKHPKDHLKSENAIARVLGWVNISLGTLTLAASVITSILV